MKTEFHRLVSGDRRFDDELRAFLGFLTAIADSKLAPGSDVSPRLAAEAIEIKHDHAERNVRGASIMRSNKELHHFQIFSLHSQVETGLAKRFVTKMVELIEA